MWKAKLPGYGECDQCDNNYAQEECFCWQHNKENPIDNWEPIVEEEEEIQTKED